MIRLYLLRHAQAAPAEGRDFDRILTKQGRADMRRLADLVRLEGWLPDHVLCSGARRTRETLALILPEADAVFEDALYDAMPGALYERLKNVPDDFKSVLLVAHNPGIHSLALFLAKPAQDEPFRVLSHGYDPGTLTVLDCACENWSDLQPRDNDLVRVAAP